MPHVKNNMIIGFTEFIESVEPQIDITKMNQKLIFPGGGCRSLRDYDNGNKPPIIMARIVAQTLGPNHQGGIAQAVQADYKYLNQEVMKEIGEEQLGYPYETLFKLFSWLSYNVGHGDPNCGNFYTWSALVFEGNLPLFKNIKELIRKKLEAYDPAKCLSIGN